MSTGREFELLGELAKLLKKYGADEFKRLAQQLSDQAFLEQLTGILSTVAKAAESVGKAGKTSGRGGSLSDLRASLESLREAEPDKSALLLELYDRLVAKRVLPTLADIRAFAVQAGLPPLAPASRPKAVVELLDALSPLPVDDVRSRLATIKPVGKEDDRSLAAWTRIILDKDLRNRPTG